MFWLSGLVCRKEYIRLTARINLGRLGGIVEFGET